MAARVTIVGWDRFVRRLSEVDDDIREGALKAVRDAAEQTRDEAREAVRVDTGAMRQGLKVSVDASRLRATVGWDDPKLYYATFQEHGTSEITANPALTAAAAAERQRFPARISADVRRELRR